MHISTGSPIVETADKSKVVAKVTIEKHQATPIGATILIPEKGSRNLCNGGKALGKLIKKEQ